MSANTPDNCYLNKGHSAHDLLAVGDSCPACGYVRTDDEAFQSLLPFVEQIMDRHEKFHAKRAEYRLAQLREWHIAVHHPKCACHGCRVAKDLRNADMVHVLLMRMGARLTPRADGFIYFLPRKK